MELQTIESAKSETGTMFKMQRKVVPGENTTYQVMRCKFGESAVVACDLSFESAAQCFDWCISGCPQ